MQKRSICLCFILLWSLSTGRSFQPSLVPQQQSHSLSTSSSTKTKKTIQHKDLATSLQVSTAASTNGARRLFQDWANKVAPVNQQQQQASSSSSSSRTSSTATRENIYEPSSKALITDYQRAKEEWANRYTNLDSLRATFGANRNKLWGDLDAATTRRLYKTLLPKALLELVKVGVQPEDLAPLAYKARVAAKMYARERCQVPMRVFCQLFDGFRQFKKYGKFQPCGMSYDQVWEKYHEQLRVNEDLTEEDVTAQICLKILERSCTTNESVDKWVLPPNDPEQREDLMYITETLENDVRKLLDPRSYHDDDDDEHHGGAGSSAAMKAASKSKKLSVRKYRTLRLVARARRRAALAAAGKKHQYHHHHASSSSSKSNTNDYSTVSTASSSSRSSASSSKR